MGRSPVVAVYLEPPLANVQTLQILPNLSFPVRLILSAPTYHTGNLFLLVPHCLCPRSPRYVYMHVLETPQHRCKSADTISYGQGGVHYKGVP